MMFKKSWLFIFILSIHFVGFSQINSNDNSPKKTNISFIENKGQWEEIIEFRTEISYGSIFLEKNAFTYSKYDAEDIAMAHNHAGEGNDEHSHKQLVDGHAWRATFDGANPNPSLSTHEKQTAYYNFFIGNDTSKWASNVALYNHVSYSELYSSIDLHVYGTAQNFKYDFIVSPKGDPNQIKMSYEGLDDLILRNGALVCITSVGEFIENAPYTYQEIDGKKVEVICNFTLKNQTVGFEFPKGYNQNYPLIIDPVLVGATYSNTLGTNWGHCATYDHDGNIFTGARNFSGGYPTDLGSFQSDFGGGHDIGISKLSPDATSLIYATYLGGGGIDLPHSLVVNLDNELYVMGISTSTNYPVSDDAYATYDMAGTGSDIIVTHLNWAGTDIIGSTYIGGSDQDGFNSMTSNYGDFSRGEIIVDDMGNCFVASSAESDDFPTTLGAHQEIYGGGDQDGVVFSMSPDLSTLHWSSYIGGVLGEAALGLRLDSEHNLFVTGVASDEFMAATGYQSTYQGGERDAFVMKFIDDGNTVEFSSYWGTSAKDAAFFIDIDLDNNVYLYGQSDGGTSEVTPGVYSNPGSHQFICKLSHNLEDLLFGTVVGTGAEEGDFVPIAFMVDHCNYIYFSGHGAWTDLPISDDAISDFGGFYLGVLKPDATDFYYATKYSGGHVDGGTSRFDPEFGTVYQGVCSCESFATSPGAYADMKFGGCDMAVFKIDFEISNVEASAEALPEAIGCAPLMIEFDNTSLGLLYEWDFGDGSPTTDEFEPTHTFTEAGTYTVQLIAYNPEGCLGVDTTYIEIIVVEAIDPEASFNYDFNCATGEITITYTGTLDVPVVFDMGDGTTYDETEFTHVYDEIGTFTITLTVGGGGCDGLAIATEEINIGAPPLNIISNNPSCFGFFDGSMTIDILEPTGAEVIVITDGAGNVLNVGGSNTANTLPTGWYYFTVDAGNGCATSDSIFIEEPLDIDAEITVIGPPCYGEETGMVLVDTVLNAQGNYNEIVYIWAPDPNGNSGQFGDSLIDVETGNYTLTINDENGCSKIYDFTIVEPAPLLFSEFGFDPAFCRLYDYQNGNGVVYGAATGGTPDYTYKWTNLETGETDNHSTWGGLNPGTYELEITDDNGCSLVQALVLDSLSPIADFSITTNQLKTDCDALVPVDITFKNKSLNFSNPNDPSADTSFFWNFNFDTTPWYISNEYNEVIEIHYEQSGTYTVCLVASNKNGCVDTSCVDLILCDPTLFVPVNIFSPNGDGINDVFTFFHKSIAVKEFYCVVIDRWGVIIAEFNSISQGWDGTDARGNFVPDGVYFYKYVGKEDTGAPIEGQGTVQLIRGN